MKANLKIAFRVDASLIIGTGHVMRCLTLANALREQGANCVFMCRTHPGNLISYIESCGYVVHALPAPSRAGADSLEPALTHAVWLGTSQRTDAEQCREWLSVEPAVDWLIVDHYGLDQQWEKSLQPYYDKLMVIDDLADRSHVCDLLLDQTYSRTEQDYQALVPSACRVLAGAGFALLRSEFESLRSNSLSRRTAARPLEILVSLGGVDQHNVTGAVLTALSQVKLPSECQVTIIMGSTAPWLETVRQQVETLPYSTRFLVGVSNMAEFMAAADLAIGAAGATAWERCCLGLPTIMVRLADNQLLVMESLRKAGAAKVIASPKQVSTAVPVLLEEILEAPETLLAMSKVAATVTDGRGLQRVLDCLE